MIQHLWQSVETNEIGPNGFSLKIREAKVKHEISVNRARNSLKPLSASVTQCRCSQAFPRLSCQSKPGKARAAYRRVAVAELTGPPKGSPRGPCPVLLGKAAACWCLCRCCTWAQWAAWPGDRHAPLQPAVTDIPLVSRVLYKVPKHDRCCVLSTVFIRFTEQLPLLSLPSLLPALFKNVTYSIAIFHYNPKFINKRK